MCAPSTSRPNASAENGAPMSAFASSISKNARPCPWRSGRRGRNSRSGRAPCPRARAFWKARSCPRTSVHGRPRRPRCTRSRRGCSGTERPLTILSTASDSARCASRASAFCSTARRCASGACAVTRTIRTTAARCPSRRWRTISRSSAISAQTPCARAP